MTDEMTGNALEAAQSDGSEGSGAPRPSRGPTRLTRLAADGPDRMGRELAEGPAGVARTLARVATIAAAVEAVRASARRVVLVGTGASWWAIQGAIPFWERREQAARSGRSILARQSAHLALVEGAAGGLGAGDLVIAVSQSGSSPETVAAARLAAAAGSSVVALTAHPGSPLAQLAQIVVEMPIGDERGAATKSHLTSLAGLLALGGALSLRPDDVQRLVTWLQDLVEDWAAIVSTASWLARARRVWFLGLGASEGVAGAAALLWHETVRRPAVATSVSEFRHGLVEATRSGDAVVVLVGGVSQPLTEYLAILENELDALGVLALWLAGSPRGTGDSGGRFLHLPAGEHRPAGQTGVAADGATLLGLSLRIQQLARGVAHAAGTYREEFQILRRLVRPAPL
jgi:fructoselysine-6-P-deglycase FrlB-like protein